MSRNIKLGIALYSPRHDPTHGRHWALAVNTVQNALSGRVSIFQAVQLNEVWSTKHLEGNLVNDEYYYGVVDLGTIRGSEDIVLDIIEDFSPNQEGYDTHGRTWSCAWWIIRALRKIQAVYPHLRLEENDLDLYNQITIPLAEQMINSPAPLHLVKMGLPKP